MKKLTLTAVALLLSAASAVAAITGTVIDPAGAPIAGVTVRAYAVETAQERAARLLAGTIDREPVASAQTAPNGAFRLDKTEAVVDIVASATGRETITRAAADGEDVVLLLREFQPRKLRVVMNGKPLANATVSISRAVAVRTAGDGTFEVAVPNTRTVGVFHHDAAPADVTITRNETDLKVDSGIAMNGRVVGADAKPVAGATLLVDAKPLAKSGDDGSFAIAHAPRTWREVYAVTADRIGVATHGAAAAYTIKLRAGVKVTGTVRDDRTRTPVTGMLLRLPFGETRTDASGAFTISPAMPGRYTLTAMHPLYAVGAGATMLVIRPDGAKESIAATALPLLSGTVIDEEKKPVGGASVGRDLMGAAADASSTWTRRDGTFSVHALVGDAFRSQFTVSKEGYADAQFTAATAKSGISVVLHRGLPVVVRVIDTEKAPVAGSYVRMLPAERGFGPQLGEVRCGGGECTTGADGKVTVNVQPGRYDVSIWSTSAVTKQLPAQVIDAHNTSITVTVERGVEVSGRVTYADGSPIDRSVYVQLEGAGAIPMNNPTDPGGTFTFRNAPRGAVTLRPETFEMPRFIGAAKEITAPAANVVLTMPRGGRISGRVVDASSGQPVTDFEVLVTRNSMAFAGGAPRSIHADDGTFTLENITPGRFEVTATAEGYSRGSTNGIDVPEGGNVAGVEVRLERAARVTSRVTSSEGQPLSGARVSVTDTSRRMGGPAAAAMTDADGNYDLTTVPPGERNITFAKEGFVSATKSVEATVNRDARLDATLDRGRDLTGRVMDDSGQAVAGAEVRLEGEPVRPVQSDTDGSFRLEGLREGHLRVMAHKNGYVDARAEADTTSTANVTLTLGHGATLNGHITGLTDAELAMTIVSYYANGSYATTRPDAAGNFSLTGVVDGRLTVEASTATQPRRSARKVVEVTNGSAPAVDLTFTAGNTVKGHVLAAGRTVSDFMVNFGPMDPSQPPGNSRIESDGSYSVSGLGTGEYRVSVMAPMVGILSSEKLTVSGDAVHDIELHTLSLHGRVTDTDGTPLSDVRVVAEPVTHDAGSPMPRTGTTDSSGHYFLDFLSSANWRISAQKEKYQTATKETAVSDGMGDVDMQLSPASQSTVRVVDARDGTPVLASVAAMQNNRSVYTTQTRASDGVADLYLAPGHYTLSVGAPRYARTTTQIDVPGPEVRVALSHGGTVIVVAPAGARVLLATADGRAFGTPTNRFENVAPGSYTAKLLGTDGKSSASKPVQVVDGQTVTITLP